MWALLSGAGGGLDGRCRLDAYFMLVQHATCLGASVSIRHLLISRAGPQFSFDRAASFSGPCEVKYPTSVLF